LIKEWTMGNSKSIFMSCPSCGDGWLKMDPVAATIEPDRGLAQGKVITHCVCLDCGRSCMIWICQSPLDVVIYWEDE
jgi:hypothetical protein